MAFPARYAGLCDSCGDAYDHGDSISYMNGFDKPVCEDCINGHNTSDAPSVEPTCPECWLVHAGGCF